MPAGILISAAGGTEKLNTDTERVDLMQKMIKELKEFIFRGNVIDMAVGVIIGAAFAAITTSLVNDMFMPLISLLTGRLDFTGLFIALDGGDYASIEAAKAVNAATLNYGSFITAVINFLLIGVCVFFFIKFINRLAHGFRKEAADGPKPAPRLCPYCYGELNAQATRCPHCTSDVSATADAIS